MKYLKFFLLLFLAISFSFKVYSSQMEGCSDGNTIYPNYTGTYFQDYPPYSPHVQRYYRTDGVHIRFSDYDSQCGIRSSVLNLSTHGRCQIQNGGGWIEGAGLVYYDTSYTNCNLPLDDYLWVLMLISGGVGFLYVKNKRLFFA